MASNETRVLYKAIADFTALGRAVRKAKKDLAELRAEEALLNSSSVEGASSSTTALGKHSKAVGRHASEVETATKSVKKSTVAFVANATASKQNAAAQVVGTTGAGRHAGAVDKATSSVKASTLAVLANAEANKQGSDSLNSVTEAANGAEQALNKTQKAIHATMSSWKKNKDGSVTHRDTDKNGLVSEKTIQPVKNKITSIGGAASRSLQGVEKLNKGLIKMGNWRPRLMPPFIALIPIIGSVLALINPLVAGLGAVGVAGLGFASSLGSIAAASAAIIPGLAALISVVGALKMAFGGIGNVFKAKAAVTKAGGAGGSGPAKAQLSQAEELKRAQDNYSRSVENVGFAEDDLDDARRGYIKRVKELQAAVDGAAASQARASANAQLAKENYANVLADPDSTQGEKMAAKASLDEANTTVVDVQTQAKDDASALEKIKRDGMEGDRQVIMAKRSLTDAINAQRDAELRLQDVKTGANKVASASEKAVDLYREALDKLSPSARAVVLLLMGMSAAWGDVRKSVQESFFKEIVGDVGSLVKLFPVLNSLLGSAAGAMGRVLSRGLKMVTSQEWINDLGIIGEQNVPIIENIGDALFIILDGLKELAIAAGPFATDLAVGFKAGSENFRDMLASARKDGSLAKYLDVVLGRMQQWWRIIKNIGATLFNYGAATGTFGKWLTDGFEDITNGWKTASETARKEGSPFQTYLERIKPLLSEVKSLFASFFGWFATTAMDPANIEAFTEIFRVIREDLGPGISNLLDTLTKTGVGTDIISALSSIVEFVDTFLKAGGADGIKAFWDAVSILFDGLNDFFSSLPPGMNGFFGFIASTFAVLAALSFFRITALIGLLLQLGRSKGLSNILGKLPKIGGAAAVAGTAGTVAGAAKGDPVGTVVTSPNSSSGVPKGERKSALAAEKSAAKSVGKFAKLAKFIPGLGAVVTAASVAAPIISAAATAGSERTSALKAEKAGTVGGRVRSIVSKGAPAAKAGGGTLAKVAGRAASGLAKGGLLGIAAVVGAGLVSDAITANAPKGKKGAGARVGASALSGAAQGAGIGALAGSIIPGVGTAIGAGVGTVIGGAVGLANSSSEDKKQFASDTGGMIADFGKNTGGMFADFGKNTGGMLASAWTAVSGWFMSLPEKIGTLGTNIWTGIQGIGTWLGERWTEFTVWLAELPANIGYAAGSLWANLLNLGDWLAERWTEFTTWLGTLPEKIGVAAGNVWSGILGAGAWLAERWVEFQTWLTTLPEKIGAAATGIWNWIVGVGPWLAERWVEFQTWLTTLPAKIGAAASGIWTGIKGVGSWLTEQGTKIWNWIIGIPGMVANGAKYLWSGIKGVGSWLAEQGTKIVEWAKGIPKKVGDAVGGFFSKLFGGAQAGYQDTRNRHNGGVIKRAGGGGVPGSGNSDTVPAMLTPGEYVVRKSIVNRVGLDNLTKFNAGVMTYAELLNSAMGSNAGGPSKQKEGSGLSFFSAGGLVPDIGTNFGGGSSPAQIPKATSSNSPAGTGITVENLVVNNPVAETASESLPRTIRKMAYFGSRG